MRLPDKAYLILKWIVVIVIPALTTFYCVLDAVFGWGLADTVGTISAAFCTMIGAIIGISTAAYNHENMDPDEDPEEDPEEEEE